MKNTRSLNFDFIMGRRFDKSPNKLNSAATKPLKRRKYTLHELVSKITPRNRHPETDWGQPLGHESC
jgi:antitoxin component of MazEF toxin-antitoxin module